MDQTAFWILMESANAEAGEQQADQAEILQKKLQTLPAGEILAFHRTFTTLCFNAYRWDPGPQRTLSAGAAANDGENALVATLARGWQQRLALGCAALHKPPILFLDEPMSGVEPASRRCFRDLIHSLASEGATCLSQRITWTRPASPAMSMANRMRPTERVAHRLLRAHFVASQARRINAREHLSLPTS